MRSNVQSRERLGDFTTDKRVLVLSLMALVIGVISALVAAVLVWLINVITNIAFFQRMSSVFTAPSQNQLGILVVIVPVIGGLVIGLMARYGSEKIRGHGIPEALEAILIGQSRMEPKVALLKPISSAISIGTGGPFGAEGPIIMTGGAFGSLFAQMFHLSSAERRTLLVAGAAGGMSAIFAAPVAAVLLAVELLLFEWKPRSLIPVAISSAVAAALRTPLLGSGPIFPVTPHLALDLPGLLVCLAVGIIAGFGSGLLTTMVYGFEDLFTKLPIHWMWWPIIGGIFVGIGGLIDPRTLGVGYDTIHALLRGDLVGGSAILLLIIKALIWSIALGSGTSGGVLAPLLIMGGTLGAIEAHWIPVGDTGLWAMISMAAMMGGTMRSPLTAMVFTLELTHDLNVLPGLLIATMAAHAVTVLLLRRSILTEKVARHGHHLVREYSVDPLELIRVGEIMDPVVPVVQAETKVTELRERIARGEPQVSHRQAVCIVDTAGRLAGIITRGDLVRAMNNGSPVDQTVLDAGRANPIVAFSDEQLRDAVERMLENEVGRLPVVTRTDPHKLVGYLGRAEILKGRQRKLQEEAIRERSWNIPRRKSAVTAAVVEPLAQDNSID